MTLKVNHTVVTGAAANPDVLVDGPAWDADHTVTGDLPVTQLNGGSGADSTTFWRGDGTWATPPSGGGGGTPGGSNTQVQYNNAGSFGGISGATTDGTTLTLVAPVLGTPASGTLTNCTIPVTKVTGMATGVTTFLATPSSANLRAALTDEVGTGAAYFVGGALGTPASATLTNATGLPLSTGVTGTLPVANGGTGATSSAAARNNLAAVGAVNKQVFTSSGTYTPSANLLYAIIECVAGGGGGGGVTGAASQIYQGGGGSSGGYSRTIASAAIIGASQTVTIGAAGSGGAAGSNNGTTGGDTSVGTLCIAKGGGGGKFGSASQVGAGGAPGVAGTGDLTATGMAGISGLYNAVNNSISFASGNGGSSIFGGGAQGVIGSGNFTGNNASNYGGGGSGASANGVTSPYTAAGGNGSAGVAFITEFCSS